MYEVSRVFLGKFFKHGFFENLIRRVTDNGGPELFIIPQKDHSSHPKHQESISISPRGLSGFINNPNIGLKLRIPTKLGGIDSSRDDNIGISNKLVIAFHVDGPENVGHFYTLLQFLYFSHYVG
jgi:hypothetical protein